MNPMIIKILYIQISVLLNKSPVILDYCIGFPDQEAFLKFAAG
ncbi:Uncharacterised protein [Elizabethkingia meningoseptica]|nr:Uncharacterised protein [Elizabethkingia meningoseptica]